MDLLSGTLLQSRRHHRRLRPRPSWIALGRCLPAWGPRRLRHGLNPWGYPRRGWIFPLAAREQRQGQSAVYLSASTPEAAAATTTT